MMMMMVMMMTTDDDDDDDEELPGEVASHGVQGPTTSRLDMHRGLMDSEPGKKSSAWADDNTLQPPH